MRLLLLLTPILLVVVACGSDVPQSASGPSPQPTEASDRPAASSPTATAPPLPSTPDGPSPAPADDGLTPSPQALYIALGDSLSEGRGASVPDSTAFVPLVHAGLGGAALLNLGVAGDTSDDLLERRLDEALLTIERRNGDSDPGNDVVLVTLEIGGNDLLDLFFELVLPGTCPALEQSLVRPQCVDALTDALDDFRVTLGTILDRLLAADPNLTVAVMTLYNPFSGGLTTLAELADAALEGLEEEPVPEGLNDVIRAEANARDAVLVDWYPLFVGKAGELISGDLIHPNDAGYRLMADAVLDAVR